MLALKLTKSLLCFLFFLVYGRNVLCHELLFVHFQQYAAYTLGVIFDLACIHSMKTNHDCM
jgi:hypothetical protein